MSVAHLRAHIIEFIINNLNLTSYEIYFWGEEEFKYEYVIIRSETALLIAVKHRH